MDRDKTNEKERILSNCSNHVRKIYRRADLHFKYAKWRWMLSRSKRIFPAPFSAAIIPSRSARFFLVFFGGCTEPRRKTLRTVTIDEGSRITNGSKKFAHAFQRCEFTPVRERTSERNVLLFLQRFERVCHGTVIPSTADSQSRFINAVGNDSTL